MVRETDRIEFDLEGPVGRRCSAATASTNASIWWSRRSQAGADCPSRMATTGSKGPAWRWPCWNSGPPTEHRSGAEMRLLPDGTYHLAVGSTEMGNGSTTSHRQIAAAVLDTRADSIAIINGDTDQTPYDTGTFASTGTVVAGKRWR